MKKLVALLLVICSLFCFASCGISDDPSEVKDKLEEEGYECIIADSKREFENYDVDEIFDFLGISMSGVEAVLVAMKKSTDDKPIVVIFCEKNKQAKNIEKDIEEFIEDDDSDEAEEALEWLEEFGIDDFDDLQLKRSGNVVALGHKDAIKIIK